MINKIKAISTLVSNTAGRGSLVLKMKSPKILMATGVVGVVVTTVMACRATLKAEQVIEEMKYKLDKINEAKELIGTVTYDPKDRYTEQDYRKDLAVVYVQTGVEFIKLYGPTVFLGIASIGCILTSHNILSKRNLALMSAYKAIEQSFLDYRKRVIDEFGVDKDRMLKNGIIAIERTVVNEDGTTTIETADLIDPNGISQYARFFDEASTQWSKIPEYNTTYLKCQQNYANDLLKSRGHIFLNEVYDMIGVPRSQAGAVVGWVKGEGDDFVDFGMFDGENTARRSFVNGQERSILLDFNVSGVIYDLI